MQVQKDDAASCGRCYLYASRRVADVTASHRPCERGTCRRSCIDSASMCRCGSAFALAGLAAQLAVRSPSPAWPVHTYATGAIENVSALPSSKS